MGAFQDWRTPRVGGRRPTGSVEGWLEKIPGRVKKQKGGSGKQSYRSLSLLLAVEEVQVTIGPAISVQVEDAASDYRGSWIGILKSNLSLRP